MADHLSDAAYVVVSVASVPGRSALDHVKLMGVSTVKRGDFDGRDFDNLIKLIISIPNSCSHSSDCRLFILPCLSD